MIQYFFHNLKFYEATHKQNTLHGAHILRLLQRFVRWNDLTLRKVKEHNHGKCASLSKDSVDHHFELLRSRLHSLGLLNSPDKILNMNETGWSKTQNLNYKFIVPKGSKHSFQHANYIAPPRNRLWLRSFSQVGLWSRFACCTLKLFTHQGK